MLEAWSLGPEGPGPGFVVQCLGYVTFEIFLSQQARQSLQLLFCSCAGQLLSRVLTVDVQGHQLGALPSTFVADSLMIKFFGTFSPNCQ